MGIEPSLTGAAQERVRSPSNHPQTHESGATRPLRPAAPALAVGERMAPAETGESAEVAIAGDPLAPRLDGQGGQIGVGHQVALGRGAGAQAAASRITSTYRMWVIYLELVVVLGIAAFILWFTWPRKK